MKAEEKYFTRLDAILGSALLRSDSLDLFVLIDKKRQLKWIEMDDLSLMYDTVSATATVAVAPAYTVRSMPLSNIDKESMIVSLHCVNVGNEALLFIVTKSSAEEDSINGVKPYHIHTYVASKEHYMEVDDHMEDEKESEVYLDVAFTAMQSLNMDYCPLSITIDSHLSANKSPVLLVTGSDNTLHAYDLSLTTMKVHRGLSRDVHKSYWEDRLGIGHMKMATNIVSSDEVSPPSKNSNTGVMQSHSLRRSMSKVMNVKYPQVGHAPMATPTVPLHFLIDNRNDDLMVAGEGEEDEGEENDVILETNQGMIGYTSGLLVWSRSVVDTSDGNSSSIEDRVLNRKERYSRMSLMMDGAITCMCLLSKTPSNTPSANLYSHAVVGLAHGAALIDLESVNLGAVMIEEALGHGILKCLTMGAAYYDSDSSDRSHSGGYEDIFMGFEDGTVICLERDGLSSSASGQDDARISLESDVAPVSEHLKSMLETIVKETASHEEAQKSDNDDGEDDDSEDDVDEEEKDDFFVSDIGLNDMTPPVGVSNRSTDSMLSADSATLTQTSTAEDVVVQQDTNDSGDTMLKRANTGIHSQEKLKFRESWRASFPFPVMGMALSEHVQYPTLSLEKKHSRQVLTIVTTKTVHCLHLKGETN